MKTPITTKSFSKGYFKIVFLLIAIPLLSCTSILAQQSLKADLDGDNIIDKVNIANTETSFSIEYSLSSQQNKTFTTVLISNGGDKNSLGFNKNILSLDCQFMRGENHFKFKYDNTLKQMKLIGYDNVQYGSATNDGSGNSSYNLATGNYEATWNYYDKKKKKLITLPKFKHKLPLKAYLLKDFNDKIIEKLNDIDYQNLPKQLK